MTSGAKAIERINEMMASIAMNTDALAAQLEGFKLAMERATDDMRLITEGLTDAGLTGTGDPLGPIYGLAQRTYEQTISAIDAVLED